MSSLREHATYWLTWIRLEKEAQQFDKVRTLFDQATSAIVGSASQKAIATAYKLFLHDYPEQFSPNRQNRSYIM